MVFIPIICTFLNKEAINSSTLLIIIKLSHKMMKEIISIDKAVIDYKVGGIIVTKAFYCYSDGYSSVAIVTLMSRTS